MKNKKERKYCKIVGHSVGDHMYRASAKLCNIQKYKKINPQLLTDNADKFNAMNRPKIINKFMQ